MTSDDVVFNEGRMVDGELVVTHVRTLTRTAMLACPFFIMMPEHYREDNTCKCDDPDEQYKMYHEWEYRKADFVRKGIPYHLGPRGKRP